MRRKLVFLICLIFLFSALASQTLDAYQSPTGAQKQKVQEKINEGNKAKEDYEKKSEEVKNAEKAGDAAAAEKARKEAEQLLEKLKKLRQKAIDLADQYYKPDNTNVFGMPRYDPNVRGEGETSKDGKVKIGEDAFSNPGWLASSKLHEYIHTDQAKNETWNETAKGTGINECEAYDKEIENAEKSGLSEDEINGIKKRRKAYYDALSTENKAKVDKGDYDPLAMVPMEDAVKFSRAKIDFIGKGVAAGNVFKLKITRTTPEPFTLEILLGTPLSPGIEGVQTMMVGKDMMVLLTDPVTIVDVPGYCLNPDFLPPPTPEQIKEGKKPEPKWTVENPWESPEIYLRPINIIQAGNKLSESGKYHIDMPKDKYCQTVIQRALWFEANPKKYNKENLKNDITEQVKTTGGKQTPEQIDNLVNNIWENVDLTLKESQKSKD